MAIGFDMERVSGLVRETAAEAVMPHFRHLRAGEVTEKQGPHDLVTIADTECERLLSQRLRDLTPGVRVLGEEACSADPRLLKVLGGPEPVWVIDPVDGTINFASGMPMFGVLLAYVVGGIAQAGWIHDPVRGRTAMAERGQGTWLDGRRVTLRPPERLDGMHGALNMRYGPRDSAIRLAAGADRLASMMVLRAAAHEYLAILDGILHFAVYHRMMPWDHAAGTLLVGEAGGVSRHFDGQTYRPGELRTEPGLLVAAGGQAWDIVQQQLILDGGNTP